MLNATILFAHVGGCDHAYYKKVEGKMHVPNCKGHVALAGLRPYYSCTCSFSNVRCQISYHLFR